MDQPGTIAAVIRRLDFLERRVLALESEKAARADAQISAQRRMQAAQQAAADRTNAG
jgi:hypothetical protein